MTMTPDELRALADALSVPHRELATVDVIRAAAYLRACADAQPVAWRCEVRGDGTDPKLGAVDWRHYATTTNESNARAFLSRCGDGIEGRAVPLYPRHAPAVPHYAMLDSHRRQVEQAIQSAEHPSGMSTHDGKARIDASILRRMLAIIDSLPAAPQAESKREPLTDERITKGEYVFATKWDDGDPGDHWGVGFYDRFANGRHYVVDSAGKQIRGNGFRRVGRITVDVGRWLLSAGKSLEASPPGTVNLWTMLTERARRIGGSDAE